LIAVLGASAVAGGLGYGALLEEGRIGPGFLPILAGATVAVCAVLDLVSRVRKLRTAPAAAGVPGHPADDTSTAVPRADGEVTAAPESDVDIFGRTQKQRNWMLVVVIAMTIATLVLVPFLGFLLSFGLLLIAVSVLVEKRKLLPSVLVTVVALAVAYGIFAVVLRVPLPVGPFGF
jgi:hypothetical protein